MAHIYIFLFYTVAVIAFRLVFHIGLVKDRIFPPRFFIYTIFHLFKTSFVCFELVESRATSVKEIEAFVENPDVRGFLQILKAPLRPLRQLENFSKLVLKAANR